MRIARRATGRDLILFSGSSYHGWHDGFTASREDHPGVPEVMTSLVATFKYNDIDDLMKVLSQYKDRVAAVMMEPALFEIPASKYLEEVRDLAHENGALFVLDEMILGGRVRYAGGQDYFSVKADLSCWGKAIGGGFAVAAVTGSRELMGLADVVSGTFGGEAVGLAACKAVMDSFRLDKTFEKLQDAGHRLMEAFAAVGRSGLPTTAEGFPQVFRLKWNGPHAEAYKRIFMDAMLACDILMHPDVIFASTPLLVSMDRIRAGVDIAIQYCKDLEASGEWDKVGITGYRSVRP